LKKSAGTGTFRWSAMTLNNTGTVDSLTGTLSLEDGGSLGGKLTTEASGVLSLASGTFDVPSGLTVTGTGVTLANAPLGGAGTVTVTGTLSWTNGTLTGSGPTQVNGTLALSGTSEKLIAMHTINNAGLIVWSGGDLGSSAGAVINNAAGATCDIQADQQIGNNLGIGTFNNSGTLKKSAGTGTFRCSAMTLNNTGTVDSLSGTLSLEDGGSLGGTLTTEANGLLSLA